MHASDSPQQGTAAAAPATSLDACVAPTLTPALPPRSHVRAGAVGRWTASMHGQPPPQAHACQSIGVPAVRLGRLLLAGDLADVHRLGLPSTAHTTFPFPPSSRYAP
jgi:hypothetical protein